MPVLVLASVLLLSGQPQTEALRPVPEDSVRLSVPGCVKGLVFTVAPVAEDQPGRSDVPEGMHFRMNGSKTLLDGIRARRGAMIEITGLVLARALEEGLGSTSRFRFVPGTSLGTAGSRPGPVDNQIVIDVEGWRVVPGTCPR